MTKTNHIRSALPSTKSVQGAPSPENINKIPHAARIPNVKFISKEEIMKVATILNFSID